MPIPAAAPERIHPPKSCSSHPAQQRKQFRGPSCPRQLPQSCLPPSLTSDDPFATETQSPQRTTTETPFLSFSLACPMVPCLVLASWNHRRACLFHRSAARLVANLKQPGCRAPRRVLRCRSTSKLRQHRAASLMMALLIRVDHVAVKPRNLFLPRGLEEFQKLRVAPGTHGFASHQGRGDALDRDRKRVV